MMQRSLFPEGNSLLLDDHQYIVSMIERHSRWVHPDVFARLPVWCPHIARNQQLYDAKWTREYTNTKKTTGATNPKVEGNIAAGKALVSALGVQNPKPKNWTVCHLWGYDDPRFASTTSVVHDPKYYSCVGNMVWLPSALKGMTDTLPSVKSILRTCAFYLYNWVCEHPSVECEATAIKSGWVPDYYPSSWPSPANTTLQPVGLAPVTPAIIAKMERTRRQIFKNLNDPDLLNYPRDQVTEVLDFWGIVND